MNREAVFRNTLEILKQDGQKLTIGQLAKAIRPTHDLETLSFWLAMARQAGVELGQGAQSIDLHDPLDGDTRFQVPWVEMAIEDVEDLKVESLE
jgi:hypothetical protein